MIPVLIPTTTVVGSATRFIYYILRTLVPLGCIPHLPTYGHTLTSHTVVLKDFLQTGLDLVCWFDYSTIPYLHCLLTHTHLIRVHYVLDSCILHTATTHTHTHTAFSLFSVLPSPYTRAWVHRAYSNSLVTCRFFYMVHTPHGPSHHHSPHTCYTHCSYSDQLRLQFWFIVFTPTRLVHTVLHHTLPHTTYAYHRTMDVTRFACPVHYIHYLPLHTHGLPHLLFHLFCPSRLHYTLLPVLTHCTHTRLFAHTHTLTYATHDLPVVPILHILVLTIIPPCSSDGCGWLTFALLHVRLHLLGGSYLHLHTTILPLHTYHTFWVTLRFGCYLGCGWLFSAIYTLFIIRCGQLYLRCWFDIHLLWTFPPHRYTYISRIGARHPTVPIHYLYGSWTVVPLPVLQHCGSLLLLCDYHTTHLFLHSHLPRFIFIWLVSSFHIHTHGLLDYPSSLSHMTDRRYPTTPATPHLFNFTRHLPDCYYYDPTLHTWLYIPPKHLFTFVSLHCRFVRQAWRPLKRRRRHCPVTAALPLRCWPATFFPTIHLTG